MFKTAYGLSLSVEQNPEGEVTPTVAVTWNISDELVEKIRKKGFLKPHLMLIAANRYKGVMSSWEVERFTPSQVRIARLETKREYVSFSYAGDNTIFAVIIDLDTRGSILRFDRIRSYPTDLDIGIDGEEIIDRQEGRFGLKQLARVDVSVPPELFAPELPRLLQALVDQFPWGRNFDQCDRRGKVILSGLATPFVQLYGLFARLGTLIVMVGIAGLRPDWRSFVAFNPHEFGRNLGPSLWDKYPDGTDRKWIWSWLNPLMFLLAVAVGLVAAFLAAIIPVLVFVVWDAIIVSTQGKGHTIPLDFWGYVAVGAGIDAFLALLITIIVTRSKLVDYVQDLVLRLRSGSLLTTPSPQTTLETLRAAAQRPAKNTTVHLFFNAAKAKVCRPIAR